MQTLPLVKRLIAFQKHKDHWKKKGEDAHRKKF